MPQSRRVAVPLHIAQSAAAPRPGTVIHTLAGTTMGTCWTIKLAAHAGEPLDTLRTEIDLTLDRIIEEMSHWEPRSDISRFNDAAAGTWHALPHDFFHVLEYALAVARDTGGAYDPTIGRLVSLWGFGPAGKRGTSAQHDALQEARAAAGWPRVVLDKKTRSALQPGGLHLDLSSVAKGFGVDRVASVVRKAGHCDFLVEIGGELRGEGVKPDGMPWWVALERPSAPAGTNFLPDLVVALNGIAVATSGSAEHFFDADGRRYSHTLDPRTGESISHGLVSVSVLHAECMHADALSTALTVLGPEVGMAHALRIGLAARFVSSEPSGLVERLTPRLAAMLA